MQRLRMRAGTSSRVRTRPANSPAPSYCLSLIHICLNCEAAREIARQVRLRDIGGIIVIDFIDMDSQANRDALLKLVTELMAADRNRTNVVGFTGLGLLEMTRKKSRRPLTKQLMHVCPACGGRGAVPSYETTARRAIREVWARGRAHPQGALLVDCLLYTSRCV